VNQAWFYKSLSSQESEAWQNNSGSAGRGSRLRQFDWEIVTLTKNVYRDGLLAWRALRDAVALDIDDRDDDLLTKLKERLDPGAPDLDSALA
jgi:hypothetical protein